MVRCGRRYKQAITRSIIVENRAKVCGIPNKYILLFFVDVEAQNRSQAFSILFLLVMEPCVSDACFVMMCLLIVSALDPDWLSIAPMAVSFSPRRAN